MLRAALSTPRGASTCALLFLLTLLVPACNDGDSVTAPVPAATSVVGTVRNSSTRDHVAGVEVRLGTATDTTGEDGRFELTGLAAGPATLRAVAAGFEDFQADVTVPSDGLDRDIWMTPVTLHVVGGMTAQAEVFIRVDRAGRSVTDASVLVGGVAIPHAGEGSYQGALPSAIPAGSPFVLQVSAGGVTVEAAGNVPETPVISAPATGSVFGFADSISITWTSTTDPDRFTGPFAPTSGSVRGARIAASDIACDFSGPFPDDCLGLESDVTRTIRVSAVRDLVGGRDFTGPAAQNSSFTIESASSAAVITITPTPVVSTPLNIQATLSPQLQSVWVIRAGTQVGNAVVTVNGVAIPRGNPAGPGGEYEPPPGLDARFYQGSLPEPVAAGLPLVLEVKTKGITVQATGKVPEAPVLTAPATGTAFTLADSITVTWTSTTDPDGFEVGFGFNTFCCGFFETPGSARELKVAASDIYGGTFGDQVMGVFAVNVGSFTRQAHSDSSMRVQNGASPDTEITILP